MVGGCLAALVMAAYGAPVRADDHEPSAVMLHYYHAALDEYRNGEYPQAIEDLERARLLDPSSPTLIYNLGRVNELAGNLDEAARYYGTYVTLLPTSASAERARVQGILRRIGGARRRHAAHPNATYEPPAPTPADTSAIPRFVTTHGVTDLPFWLSVGAGGTLFLIGGVVGLVALDRHQTADGIVIGRDGTYEDRQQLREQRPEPRPHRRLALRHGRAVTGGGGAALRAAHDDGRGAARGSDPGVVRLRRHAGHARGARDLVRRAAWTLLVGAAALCAGCSAIVAPSSDPTPCRLAPDGTDPCPDGLACNAGHCSIHIVMITVDAGCTPQEEVCDGKDDDCDGMIDEGQDADGDGVTWCGGGVQAQADCDDHDPNIHPANPGAGIPAANEQCDGKDDDCDGMVDEGDTCPSGQMCVPGTGCVIPNCNNGGPPCSSDDRCDVTMDPPTCVSGRCPTTPCTGAQVCDTPTGSCVTRVNLGDPCTIDTECPAGATCMPAAALGLTASGNVCGKACCKDEDCTDVGGLCLVSGTGARSCVPPAMAMRGESPTGSMCTMADSCSSGICYGATTMTPGACVDGCANQTNCPMSDVCGLASSSKGSGQQQQLACIPPVPQGHVLYDTCATDDDCVSDLCVPGPALDKFCSLGCLTSDDCQRPSQITRFAYCGVTQTPSGNYVRACLHDFCDRLTLACHGLGRTGDSCSKNADCRDNVCLGSQCADTCCSSNDCTATTRCRPLMRGDHYEMLCRP